MSYKLHYAMLLEVKGMIDRGGVGFTAEKAAAALREMADRVEAHPDKLKEIFGSPLGAEVEDRWVLRSATLSNVIRKAAGGWVEVDAQDIDLEDTLPSSVIAERNLNPGPDGLWSRPEDIFGRPVLARLRLDNGEFAGQLDMREWLAVADEEDIAYCIERGWDFSEKVGEADPEEVVNWSRNPLAYDANLERLNSQGIAHTTAIETDQLPFAIAYLDELRPGFIDRIGARPAEDAGVEP